MSPWLTLTLQWLVGAIGLAVGLVALRVARHPATGEPHRCLGWFLVGSTYVIAKCVDLAQSTAAIAAVWSGVGSTLYEAYLSWAPALNHSRTGAEITLGCLLMVLAVRGPGSARFRRASLALLVAGLIGGACIGSAEGRLVEQVHFSAAALGNVLQLVVFCFALIILVARNTVDWVLWLILTIQMLTQGMNAIWMGALAWIAVPGAWAPDPWLMQANLVAMWAASLLLARHRLALARRGAGVPALLQIGDVRVSPAARIP